MNTTGQQPRSALDRVIDRIGCFLVLLPVGAAVLYAVAEVFKVPVVLLLLGLMVFISSDGSTPLASSKDRTRRPPIYLQTRRILDAYDDGRITAEERDKRLKELNS